MTDKVYAYGSVIQVSGMNHVVGVMANEKQAEDVVRFINTHDDLVKALRDARWRIVNKDTATDDYKRLDAPVVMEIDAVLAKVGVA